MKTIFLTTAILFLGLNASAGLKNQKIKNWYQSQKQLLLAKNSEDTQNEVNPFTEDMLSATPQDIINDNQLQNSTFEFNPSAQFFTTGNTANPYANDPNIRQDANMLPEYMFKSVGKLTANCVRETCAVYAYVNKTEQVLYLYLEGQLVDRWLVSTGDLNHETPLFDRRPTGPIFDAYSSKKFPGGDYEGLGNMPYAVFIKGGFALHGTTVPNFRKLGSKQSHGCIRQHSDNGYIFNRLVRKYGLAQTWVKLVE